MDNSRIEDIVRQKAPDLITVMHQLTGENLIFNFHRHINTDFCVEKENSSLWTMIIFVKGGFIYRICNEEYNINSETFSYCFIPPQNSYLIKSSSKEIEYITLMFNMECCDFQNLITPKSATPDMTVLFEHIRHNMLHRTQIGEERTLEIIAYTVAQSLYTQKSAASDIKPLETTLARIAAMKTKIEAVIEENIFNSQLSVDFIAKQIYISTSYLYRCCMYNFGMPPSEYINECKLKKACELILTGSFSLSEISNNLNFCSQSYFSTRFKKKYGMSPLQYSRYINKS